MGDETRALCRDSSSLIRTLKVVVGPETSPFVPTQHVQVTTVYSEVLDPAQPIRSMHQDGLAGIQTVSAHRVQFPGPGARGSQDTEQHVKVFLVKALTCVFSALQNKSLLLTWLRQLDVTR